MVRKFLNFNSSKVPNAFSYRCINLLRVNLGLVSAFQQARNHMLHELVRVAHNTTQCYFHLFTINIVSEVLEIIYKIRKLCRPFFFLCISLS